MAESRILLQACYCWHSQDKIHPATWHLRPSGVLIRASPMSRLPPCPRPRKLQTDGMVDRGCTCITVSRPTHTGRIQRQKPHRPSLRGSKDAMGSEIWWIEASRSCPERPKDLGIHRINPTWIPS